MAKQIDPKLILEACRLSFHGKSYEEVGEIMGVHKTAIYRWRKTELWEEFESELIAHHKRELIALGPQPVTHGR